MTESKYDIWLPEATQNLENVNADDQLKIALVGPSKGGKSWVAATAPKKPIFFIDWAGRLASVAGKPGVLGKTYSEHESLTQHKAWQSMITDFQMFEYNKLQKKGIPGTLVFDDMDFMLNAADRFVMVNNPSEKMRRVVKIDQTKSVYVPVFDTYKAEMSLVSNILARAVELGVDVIAIFHERAEEAPDSTLENPKFTGKFTVHPPRCKELLPIFNDVWRIKPQDNGKYTVYTSPNYEFLGCKTIEVDSEEIPNIEEMIKKHYKNKEVKSN